MKFFKIYFFIAFIAFVTLISKSYSMNLTSDNKEPTNNQLNDSYVKNFDIGKLKQNSNNYRVKNDNPTNDIKKIDTKTGGDNKTQNRKPRSLDDIILRFHNKVLDTYYTVKNYFTQCSESLEYTNRYVTEDIIYTTYTKCGSKFMVKEWANLQLETFMGPERCYDLYKDKIPLGNLKYFLWRNFTPKNFSIENYYFPYSVMVKYLNNKISKEFNREFVLDNYIRACQNDDYCSAKAIKTNKTVETLITEYSNIRKEILFSDYILENQIETINGIYKNFFLTLRSYG